jgi:hypothetical protein
LTESDPLWLPGFHHRDFGGLLFTGCLRSVMLLRSAQENAESATVADERFNVSSVLERLKPKEIRP